MKPLKKFTSYLLLVSIIFGIFSLSAFTGSAVVEIIDGDFSYVKNSDNTYSLYNYYGEEKDITLPSTVFNRKVTSVYAHAFENSQLTSVTIPDNYLKIEENAFYGCESLASVKISSTVTEIGNMAFGSCAALAEVDFADANSLTLLGYSAFSGDTALKSVALPSSLLTINGGAFAETGLTSVELPDSVTALGSQAFMNCAELAVVSLSDKITEIADDTFYGCTALTEVKLPSKLTSIGANAFKDCASLSGIELPVSLKTIGESAFENASALKELFIYDGVTDIGANAFFPMSVQKSLTVTCYKDSYTAEYCYENFVQYNAVEKILGDVNLDGELTILDATLIQKYRINTYSITSPRARELADVNKDGNITVRDATLIQMKLAKFIDEF